MRQRQYTHAHTQTHAHTHTHTHTRPNRCKRGGGPTTSQMLVHGSSCFRHSCYCFRSVEDFCLGWRARRPRERSSALPFSHHLPAPLRGFVVRWQLGRGNIDPARPRSWGRPRAHLWPRVVSSATGFSTLTEPPSSFPLSTQLLRRRLFCTGWHARAGQRKGRRWLLQRVAV